MSPICHSASTTRRPGRKCWVLRIEFYGYYMFAEQTFDKPYTFHPEDD